MLNEACFQASLFSCARSFLQPHLFLLLALNLQSSYNELCLDPENYHREKQLLETHSTEDEEGGLQDPDNLAPGEVALVTEQLGGKQRGIWE